MGQPIPPGDVPLIEGLDASWNEFVGALPEDKRAELGPKLKERIAAYEPYKQWDDLQKSGITPDQASTALQLMSVIENDPKQVYDTLAKHLNITPAQAKEVVDEIQEGDQDDPRIAAMQEQLNTLGQIALAQRQMTAQEQLLAQQEAAVEKEISDVKKKYSLGSDFPEDEIVMRMIHKEMSAEDAYREYAGRVDELRARRPAPRIMGSGGVVPANAIDPKKLDNAGVKNLVAQMMEHGNQQERM